ncbi:MAG: PIG-L family deacetylase [Candidatus Hydrogenedentes bacterium]|nr:PIG-L family deacetylase [Candidatus Hydrogenedentota bacterium]
MHTAMIISPHADDAAAFCGGTIARFADEGWRIILVRVTDDAKDSVDLTRDETIHRNTEELHDAARILGVAEVVELGYETDCLADVSLVALRERFVWLFRKYQPYAVFSFDPFGMYEGNMDQIRTAQAVEEAYWVACFHLHHPEHFDEGLEPFSVCERWYFARQLPDTSYTVDITEYLGTKVQAMAAHRTMVANIIKQSVLQLKTWGRQLPMLEAAMAGDPEPLLAQVFTGQAEAAAAAAGMPEGRLAEAFRLARFGDMEDLFQAMAEPLPGATAAPVRPGLDRA